jgi:phosphate transport system substrate-binding protein
MLYLRKQSSQSAQFLLALLLGLSVSQLVPQSQPGMMAQSEPAFPLPSSVPSGTALKLDGSPSMSVVNQTFKQRFEEKFAGTQLNLTTSTSDQAIQELAEGKIDVAALGRPLTDAEKAQGLKPLTLNREKIAILLGPDNPFQGDISFTQFAKIFRGEITDWSELGGIPGPIRFIDRPATSDTRLSLSRYKVFEDTPFQTGTTAKPVAQDETAAIIPELGKDGISYTIASHVLNNDKVRIVPMHKTLPDDPRYPYSQPRNYVYKTAADGSVSPAVQAFLGYAGSADGAKVLQEAQLAEAAAAGAAVAVAANAGSPSPAAATNNGAAATNNQVAQVPAANAEGSGFPWWILPLAALGGGFLWWLLGRKGDDHAAIAEPRELAGVGARPTPKAPEFTGQVNPPPVAPSGGVSAGGAAGTAAKSGLGAAGGVAAGLGAAAVGAGLAGAAAMGGKTWNSRLHLIPRTPTEAEASWGWEVGHRDALKQQGGRKSMMRLYDVTNIDPDRQPPHSVRQYDCAEAATTMRVPITASDRDYVAELGYVTEDGRWLKGMRSNKVHIPGAPSTSVAGAAPTATSTTATSTTATPTTGPAHDSLKGAAIAFGGAAAGLGAVAGAAALGRDVKTPVNRMGLKPFGESSVYANWDITPSTQATAKQQGGKTLQLRVYDTTGIDLDKQPPNNVQTFNCQESSHDKIIRVPHPGRDYVAEVGYATDDQRWLPLARSQSLAMSHPSGLGIAGAAAGAAAIGGVAAATSPKWGQTIREAAVPPQHLDTERYTIDGTANSFVLTPEQTARLNDQSAATQTLTPGHYTLRIKSGTFSYRPLSVHPGEPWVLIWLKGAITGQRTQTPVNATWLTLNGYHDEYKFEVHAPTKLHAFFVDTNVADNDGEVTLAITRDR